MSSESVAPILIPLVPIQPSSIGLLDLILPPLLIGLSLVIYDLTHLPPKKSRSAHLFLNTTAHARLKPIGHCFSYRILQFGLDIDRLARGELDIPYLFRFIDPSVPQRSKWSISQWLQSTLTSIHPRSYLYESHPRSSSSTQFRSLRSCLLEELKEKNYVTNDEEIGKIYLLTMPTYLSFPNINPLSVYFCYEPMEPNHQAHPLVLKLVVLEVHNTFEERHLYILKVGVAEQAIALQTGFEHCWKIARSFHVSPFNDRSGFYEISLTDPFSKTTEMEQEPQLKLKILFITPTGEKKFFATLEGSGVQMNPMNLMKSLLRYPFSLLLTSLRILYQSSILHFGKPRLDVYPRPEQAYGVDSDQKGANPIEKGGQLGAIGWQKPAGKRSEWAKQIVIDYLQHNVDSQASQALRYHSAQKDVRNLTKDDSIGSFEDLGSTDKQIDEENDGLSEVEEDQQLGDRFKTVLTLVLRPTDQTEAEIQIIPHHYKMMDQLRTETLTIDYATPEFFQDLLVFPTPQLALVVNSEHEANWTVSSRELFLRAFTNPDDYSDSDADRRDILTRKNSAGKVNKMVSEMILKIRTWYLKWQLSFIGRDEVMKKFTKRTSWLPPPDYLPIEMNERYRCERNPIDIKFEKNSSRTLFMIFIIVFSSVFDEVWGRFLFEKVFRFRFAINRHPWLRYKRAIFKLDHSKLQDSAGLGSWVNQPSS